MRLDCLREQRSPNQLAMQSQVRIRQEQALVSQSCRSAQRVITSLQKQHGTLQQVQQHGQQES